MSRVFTTRPYFKPLWYPWAFEAYEQQQKMHWTTDEVPLHEDVLDWNNRLTPAEKNLLTQIFRFFTQGDIDVSEGYVDKYLPKFRLPELRMMLLSFGAMEAVHVHAYSLLLETVGMPETEYAAFADIKEMADKHLFVTEGASEMVKDFTEDQRTAFDIAVFSAFTEGLHLFSSFAILLNFTRFKKMKGMGTIVTLSIRDESLHVEGMMKLFSTIIDENPRIWTPLFEEKIREMAARMVEVEDAFIDRAFSMGPIEGLEPSDIKQYMRYLADRRLLQLGSSPLYGVKKNHLSWLTEMLNSPEHTNFFEGRATAYSKGGLNGSWNDVWGFSNEEA